MKFDLKRLSRVYESVYDPGDPNEINKTPGEKLKKFKRNGSRKSQSLSRIRESITTRINSFRNRKTIF